MKLPFKLHWENAITIAERVDYSLKLDDTKTVEDPSTRTSEGF